MKEWTKYGKKKGIMDQFNLDLDLEDQPQIVFLSF